MITSGKILKEELEALKEEVIQRMKDSGQYASGKTAEGLETAVESNTHGWLGGYSYFGVLESGRRPGKIPVYFKEIIKRWIIAKGIQYQNPKDLERMASSIAWIIHKQGSYLHRYGYKVDVIDTPLRNFQERLSNRLGSFYATEIINNIF